ncbi:MAG TPA: hypothetical protein VI758_08980 [Bacteroidota bacterium]
MRIRYQLSIIGLALALIATGCDKLKNSTEPQTAPTFPTLSLKGPNTTSGDTHAQQTITTITTLNAQISPAYLALVASLTPTQNGDTWTWLLSQGTLTLTTTATKQPDGSFAWTVKVNGTDPTTDSTYTNWVALSGTSSADAKSGNFNTYLVNSTTPAGNVVWSKDASGNLTATFTYYVNGTPTGKAVVVNNTDNSGELQMFTGTTMTSKSVWAANGSGTWWTYEIGTGTQTGTGTWS